MSEEEKQMLIEMRNNCLNASVYDDENRLLKANAIAKALIQENQLKEVREYIEKASYFQGNKVLEEKELLEILDKEVI